MISFDQVLLLEEKVESAVKKIEQLNAENAALRRRCAELSNALNAKSEQFSSFQTDQSKIEEGILKALSRLNAVENVVLHSAQAAQSPSSTQTQNQVQNSVPAQKTEVLPEKPVLSEPSVETKIQNPVQVQAQESIPASSAEVSSQDIGFEFGESDLAKNPAPTENTNNNPADSSQPLFDIF